MSDTNENSTMSMEQKFLGVTSKIGSKPDEVVEPEGEIDIEIIDDVEEKPEKKDKVFAEDVKKDEPIDEEILNVDKGVQKRIDQLTAKHHEERRQKEQAAKLRDEAIIYAQRVKSENDRLNRLVSDGQQYLGKQAEERAGFAKQAAEQKYKQAYEQGNTEEMVAAQDALTRATMDAASAEQFNARIPEEQFMQQQQQQEQQFIPQQQTPPRPDDKAISWQAKNQWFGNDSEMTSFAYGVHEKLVREKGINPQSDEYYEKIDSRMKQVFPDFFGSNASAVSANSQSSVVAPATRNNGAKPRKVQLTATQVALAKRLGVTPEQYANQLVKDMSANN